MEPELDQLQAPCTYVYTVLKLACYYYNPSLYSYIKNNSERAMHGSIQALMQSRKPPKVHFDISYFKNKPLSQQMLLMLKRVHCCQEHEETPGGLFGNHWYKNYVLLHTFLYKHVCYCTLCDVL